MKRSIVSRKTSSLKKEEQSFILIKQTLLAGHRIFLNCQMFLF